MDPVLERTSMLAGYSDAGRMFLFENTPTVIKLVGIHLQKIDRVRLIQSYLTKLQY